MKPPADASHRLEAATSRLEDMVPSLNDSSAPSANLQPVSSRSLADERALGGSTPTPQQPIETLPPAIDDFDALIETGVSSFVNVSEEIGGLVAEQVCLLRCAMIYTGHTILISFAGCSSPSIVCGPKEVPYNHDESQKA